MFVARWNTSFRQINNSKCSAQYQPKNSFLDDLGYRHIRGQIEESKRHGCFVAETAVCNLILIRLSGWIAVDFYDKYRR